MYYCCILCPASSQQQQQQSSVVFPPYSQRVVTLKSILYRGQRSLDGGYLARSNELGRRDWQQRKGPSPHKKTKTNSNTSVTTISPPSNSFLALYARWSLHINTLALALSLLSKIIERAMERKKKEAWLHITSWQRRTALVYHWPPTVGVAYPSAV